MADGSPPAEAFEAPTWRTAGIERETYPRLRGSLREAEAIRDLFGSGEAKLALGFEAHREALLDGSLKRYAILHFATHGRLHPESEQSGLVLSLVDRQGQRRPGFVQTFEIAALDLQAELVVLSACETGLGEVMAGEGILGLPWAFLHAGTRRVVSSLWRVDDSATAELMARYYEKLLAEGLGPAAALRAAQLDALRKPGSNPYEWAGFVFSGDWRRPELPVPEPAEGRDHDG